MTSTTGKEIDPNGVNHPKGYNRHPSGIETIEVIRHMPFNLGCAFKYVVRWKEKDGIKDLQKAVWYLTDLIDHPPMLAQTVTSGQVKYMVDQYGKTEENETARLFFVEVLNYVRGMGPSCLVRARRHCNQLLEDAQQLAAA